MDVGVGCGVIAVGRLGCGWWAVWGEGVDGVGGMFWNGFCKIFVFCRKFFLKSLCVLDFIANFAL